MWKKGQKEPEDSGAFSIDFASHCYLRIQKKLWNAGNYKILKTFIKSPFFPRVSEPACFGAAPAPGERENNVGIFLTDYELSKIRSKTCTCNI